MQMKLPMAILIAICCAQAHALGIERMQAGGQNYIVARVDPDKDRVELFPAPRTGNTFSDIAQDLRRRGRKLAFAMNAGMYHPDYSAVGLLVIGGRKLKPLNTAPHNPAFNFTTLPNGVFAITKQGARVVESSQYRRIAADTMLATQSGPALVLDGRLHPRFRKASTSRHVRNGVGVTADGAPVFAISETAVTLYEFASFFRDRLECPNALYFDGSVSSLHAPALDRSDSFQRLGPVVGVVE